MPQNKFALARYRLIDELLRKRECVKTMEIVETCQDQLGFKVTARTIQMDMDALQNDPFLGCFLPICYCNRRKAYYYSEEPGEIFLALRLSEEEFALLQKLKEFLHDKMPEDHFQLYCSFLRKILNYCNN